MNNMQLMAAPIPSAADTAFVPLRSMRHFISFSGLTELDDASGQ
jgi:hypothetical protein